MPKSETPSFVHELRLKLTPQQASTLDRRLNIARQIYNACLGEGLQRLTLMRQSKDWRCACKMPKKVKNAKGREVNNKARQELFKSAREKHEFGEYALHEYTKYLRQSEYISEHVDSSTAQKIATRAFDSLMKYAIGKRGRPRFKPYSRFSNVEGKSNATGIRWVDGKIKWGKRFGCGVHYDLKDKHGLEAYALSCKTKYVRLVRRTIKGKTMWYAQLIQEGCPYIKGKNTLGDSIVGLDIGPSTIAMVGKNSAQLQAFCPEVDDLSKRIKVLQRKMNRLLRQNNPENFEEDRIMVNSNGRYIKKLGKVKKGSSKWIRSKQYTAMRNEASELQRLMAATRKRSHGELSNKILSMGTTIKTEKLSYKGFQKNFGKSVGKRAPGLLIEILRRKAENAGGEVIEFNTRTTALSQSCQCGNKQKKALKDRWHDCQQCGIQAQRDLYSAFLARFVQENKLDSSQALCAWPGAGILLEQAVSSLNETTISKTRLASFGLGQRQSCLSVKKESVSSEALDVVTIA